MGAMVSQSQITNLTIVYSTVYSGADQRKHQSPASLAFVWGIHLWPVNSPHTWPVTQKMFPFDDVIMDTFVARSHQTKVELTHSGWDNMVAIAQTTFSNHILEWKCMTRLKFHVSLFLRFALTILQYWFRKWLGADQATSHYLDQCWFYWHIHASLGLNELKRKR